MIPAGPDPDRVVQVRAHPSFGTGYLIGPGLVLTAAHVVTTADGEPSATVTVGLPGGERSAGTLVWWTKNERVDAALVRTEPIGTGSGSPRPAPDTRFGSFVTAQPDQEVEAIGFPRLQKYASRRDQEQFTGLLSPVTGAVSGTYEFTSSTPLPGPAPDTGSSQWAGMSGAAVFSAGLLVGVVRSDRRPLAGTRLTATPVSALLADEAFRQAMSEATGWDQLLEPVELSRFLQSPYPHRDLRSVASLLRADAQTVAFHGREAEDTYLDAWCVGPEPTAVLIVTGKGGEGKSRLGSRTVARLRERGWTAGVLRPAFADEAVDEERFGALARVRGPLLIVVDYAENHPRQVRALLRQARTAPGPVRVLLLARERGSWAEALDEPDPDIRDLLAGAPELALEPLTATAEDWNASFRRAVRDIARALPTVPGHSGPDWEAIAEGVDPLPEDTHRRPRSALGIQMTALTLLLQQASPVSAAGTEPVERTLLRHEEAYWTRAAQRGGLHGLDTSTLRSAVAALHLVTMADRTQAVAFLEALGIRDSDRGRIAARWLHELYPQGENAYLGSVQPDRLAEFLLVLACEDDDDLLTRVVAGAARCGDPEAAAQLGAPTASLSQMTALREAVRAARSQAGYGNPVQPLLRQIEHTASLPVISDETLAWTVANLRTLPSAGASIKDNPDGSQTITSEMDEASAALEIAGYRRGAHSMVADDPRQQGFVHMLHSMTLAQLGRPAQAVELSARAVECFRSFPGCEPELALELHRQAKLLLGLGRDGEAVGALREEVRLRQVADPEATDPALRTALDTLITTLCRAGRLAEARPYARQEAELPRQSAAPADPEAARPHLIALIRCAEILHALEDHAEALRCCSRAEEFLAGLPAPLLDGLTAERAMLGEVRAGALGGTGDRAAEAAAWQESAALWLRLDEPYQQRDPVVRAVACLNNAAVRQDRLGEQAAALSVIREALELALGDRGETLRRTRPELYEAVHATYVGYLVHAGRPADALREAERLENRPGPSTTPLPPSFAYSLREAGLALAAARRPGEAARATGIALATLRALDPPADDRTLSLLFASTLSDHAANLAEAGNHTEGAEAAREAAGLWRRLCAGQPALRVNLASVLANQAMCLRLGARFPDAARTYAEAADVLREVAPSPRDRVMLADVLSGQGACLADMGDHRAAVRARAEEALLREELWRTDPSAGPGMARACTELADSLSRIGRAPEALAAVEQALSIYHRLYGERPGAAHWREVARAHMVCGTVFLMSREPVSAVAPLMNACAMALSGGDERAAAACRSLIDVAQSMDPARVSAEMERLLGG